MIECVCVYVSVSVHVYVCCIVSITYTSCLSCPMIPSMQKRQIVVDLPRTNPTIELFQDERVQLSLHRLLYIWAIRHPGTGYVQVRDRFVVWIALLLHCIVLTHAAQGMNDLATPFFVVFLCSEIGIVYAPKTVEGVDEEILQRVEADTCVAKRVFDNLMMFFPRFF